MPAALRIMLYCRNGAGLPPQGRTVWSPPLSPPAGGTTKPCSVACGNLPRPLFTVGGRPPTPPDAAFGRQGWGVSRAFGLPRVLFVVEDGSPRPSRAAFGRESRVFQGDLSSVTGERGVSPVSPVVALGRGDSSGASVVRRGTWLQPADCHGPVNAGLGRLSVTGRLERRVSTLGCHGSAGRSGVSPLDCHGPVNAGVGPRVSWTGKRRR